MLSPIDRTTPMERTTLESGLTVFHCPASGGYWIPADHYWRWHEMATASIESDTLGDYDPADDDTDRPALICPESGALLTRYRVGHGLNFSVDRSPTTGGVWLDSGEWEALKARHLDTELHHIFTSAYQFRVRSEEFEDHLEDQFAERIGGEDFARVKGFREWMIEHPRARDVLCYLQDGLTTK